MQRTKQSPKLGSTALKQGGLIGRFDWPHVNSCLICQLGAQSPDLLSKLLNEVHC